MLLIWLYVLAIAVLIGAALNAAVESLWPLRDPGGPQAATVARPGRDGGDGMNPGLDTGEIDLPPNRPPAENPLADAEQR